MIPTEVPEILIKDFYLPEGRAKHSERDKIFQIYSDTRNGDLLLCGLRVEIDRELVIIPAHFQRADLTNTVWEHFKSTAEHPMTYLVHGLGVSLDSFERYVLYSPQYESGQKLLWEQWADCLARPEGMFFSQIERDGYKGLRFKMIG